MQSHNSICLSCIVLSLLTAIAAADDAAEIKELIPAAAAMSTKDFTALARAVTAPKVDDVAEKSLTLLLFAMPIKPDEDEKALEQFRFLADGGVIKPSELAAEIYRATRIGNLSIPRGPVTMIHADRITACTCKVEGDLASGTVSFKVPELYQGEVDYVAQRTDDKWQIIEFAMPARGIHVVRGDDGKWKAK